MSNEINSTLKLPVLELGESVALTLAIHDFQGHTVTVDNFVCNGNSFSGTIKFHFYDHLDWIMMIINIYQDLVIGTHYNIMISLMENIVHL